MIKSVGYPLNSNTRYKFNVVDQNVREALPDLKRILTYFDIPFEQFKTQKQMILDKNSDAAVKIVAKKKSLNIFLYNALSTKPQINDVQISTSGDIYKFAKNELKPKLQSAV